MGKPVTSDIDRVTSATTELVDAVSHPMFAEHVPHQLTGINDPEEALLALRRPGHAALVVTLGSKGAIAVAGDRVVRSSGYAVRAVDTTGAGDVFRGAFIFGILNDWPIERTLQFANAAAAISCTRTGAMSGVPSLPEASALVETSTA
jgi:sulfofructose kinase